MVFLLLCELTRSAIYGSQKFDSHKWPTVLVDEVKLKENRAISMRVCVDHFFCILLFYNIFLPTDMHFIENGYKRFSKTNSTDPPRQRVPLKRGVWEPVWPWDCTCMGKKNINNFSCYLLSYLQKNSVIRFIANSKISREDAVEPHKGIGVACASRRNCIETAPHSFPQCIVFLNRDKPYYWPY